MNTNKDIEIRPQDGFQMSFASSNVDVVFGGGNLGGGKLQPLDSKILTPSGWQTMGDMKVGSKVMTPFDGIATVIAVFPQGVKDVYELTTLDGRKCECGLEHLWTVRTPKQVNKYRSHNISPSSYEKQGQPQILYRQATASCWHPLGYAGQGYRVSPVPAGRFRG